MAEEAPPWTGSVLRHPAYCALYRDNPTALMDFITHAKGMTYEDAKANTKFCNGLLGVEKGDPVDYNMIIANLPRLTETQTATKDMPQIVDGLKELLRLREDWLTASVRYWVSDCWLAMIRNYFVTHDDPELTRLRHDAPPLAQQNFYKYRQQFSPQSTLDALQSDISSLRARVGEQLWLLIDHKKTMQSELGTFQEIRGKIDAHFIQLASDMIDGMTVQPESTGEAPNVHTSSDEGEIDLYKKYVKVDRPAPPDVVPKDHDDAKDKGDEAKTDEQDDDSDEMLTCSYSTKKDCPSSQLRAHDGDREHPNGNVGIENLTSSNSVIPWAVNEPCQLY
ncbi:hypothetical protein DV735_g3312, partial [Chaetothyriales sp. CBS 134920]